MPPIPTNVRLLLAQLELISHGSTARWNPAGGHSDDESVSPFGESNPPHIELRDAYLRQAGDAGRTRIVASMHAELRAARGVGVDRSQVVGETTEEEVKRILAKAGFHYAEVARLFNTTPTRVRRLRIAAGRDAHLGELPDVSAADEAADECDAKAEAQRMKSQGMTERQIALALGRGKSTIHDWVKNVRAAAA